MVTSRSPWSARTIFLLLSLTLLVGMSLPSWSADITAQDCREAAARSNPVPPSCHGRRVLETTIINTQQGQPVCRVEKVEYVCPKPHEGIRLSHQLEYFLLGDGFWSAAPPLQPPADGSAVPPPDPLWIFITTSPYSNGVNDVMVGFLEGLFHVDKPPQMRQNLNYNRGFLVGAVGNVGSMFVPAPGARGSLRLAYLGKTPGKGSSTGQAVIDRMRTEGKIMVGPTGETLFQASDGKWYDISLADMAHTTDAVTWWNTVGRFFGAKAPEVRAWMLDPTNYYLELYSLNRSAGAKLGQTYLPPLK
jgi:hypothetical protein